MPGFETTVAVYRSRLWRLLQPRLLNREELSALRVELLDAFHLYQADQEALSLAAEDLIEQPYLCQRSPAELSDGLRELAPPACLDWLALLCTLYRLALDDVELDIALELRAMVRDYYVEVFQTLEIGRFGLQGEKELQFLIEMRVLRGDTCAGPPEWAMERARSVLWRADQLAQRCVRGRRKSDGSLLRKLPSQLEHKIVEAAIGWALFPPPACRTPIVHQSPDTRSLELNRARLVAQRDSKIQARILAEIERGVAEGRIQFG